MTPSTSSSTMRSYPGGPFFFLSISISLIFVQIPSQDGIWNKQQKNIQDISSLIILNCHLSYYLFLKAFSVALSLLISLSLIICLSLTISLSLSLSLFLTDKCCSDTTLRESLRRTKRTRRLLLLRTRIAKCLPAVNKMAYV